MTYEQTGMETYMSAPATLLTKLPIGVGHIGEANRLEDGAETAEFARELYEHGGEVTTGFEDTAFCVEDRPLTQVGDETDPAILRDLITDQVTGAITLGTTFALIAAGGANVLADSQTIDQTAKTTAGMLSKLGYRNAAHHNCGAGEGLNKLSEDKILPSDKVAGIAEAFGPVTDGTLNS